MIRHAPLALVTALAFGLTALGCDGVDTNPQPAGEALSEAAGPAGSVASSGVLGGQSANGAPDLVAARAARARPRGEGRGPAAGDGPHYPDAAVYDIAAAPDGSILLAQNTDGESSVKEIRFGRIGHVADVPVATDDFGASTTVNGLAVNGRRSFFATTGGTDLGIGAGLWHVTASGARLVGDIEAFETSVDPDATWWKNPECEFVEDQYTAGPQSNPYHLTTDGGGTAAVADAAGNALLVGGIDGALDWVAVFPPPTADGSDPAVSDNWLVLFPLNEDETCYVQPVPTSVAVGPDGAYYVGELTGAITPFSGVDDIRGLARVWRIEPGARNVRCPSDECELALTGLTSVIDLAFGPDGALHVVEYDEASWLGLFTGLEGGTVSRCDVGSPLPLDASAACDPVGEGLFLPSAIAFDKRGDLWLLEGNIAAPKISKLELD